LIQHKKQEERLFFMLNWELAPFPIAFTDIYSVNNLVKCRSSGPFFPDFDTFSG